MLRQYLRKRLPPAPFLWPLPSASLPLGALRAVVMRADGRWERVPLHHSPYYQALARNDRNIYDRYRDSALGLHWPEALPFVRTWDEHLELVASLRDRGFVYDPGAPVVVQDDNLLADGQHRMSVLMHLHGPQLHIRLRRGGARLEPPVQWHLSLFDQPCRVVMGTAAASSLAQPDRRTSLTTADRRPRRMRL